MKNKILRVISLTLCLTMILPLFAACGVHTPAYTWGNGGTPVVIDPVVQTSGGITLQAEGAQNGIISTLSVFKVTTENDMSEEELISSLTVTPKMDFAVTKTGEKAFDITPAKELEEGTLYRFTVGDPENPTGSFVFQTESNLVIKSVFPADKSSDVPVNTGIEISFSEAIAPDTDFSKYISNENGIKGHFELYPNGKTLAFIPEKDLEKGQIYTFNVKEGISSVSGKTLSEGREFKFLTQTEVEYESSAISLVSSMLTFSKEEAKHGMPVGYRLYSGRNPSTDNKINVSVYAFSSVDEAAKAIIDMEKQKEEYLLNPTISAFSLKGLKKVAQTEFKGEDTAEGKYYSNSRSIVLPALEKGVYIAEMTFTGKIGGKKYQETLQCLIQISNLTVYTEQNENDMLIWVNNGNQGINGSIKGYYFDRYDFWNAEEPEGDIREEYTLKNGISTFEVPDRNAAIFTVTSENDALLVTSVLRNVDNNGKAMAYLFTDRTVYFGNDKISFSGIVKGIDKEIDKELCYSLGYTNLYYPLTLNEDGTFEGEIILENREPNYYMPLRILDKDLNLLAVQYLRITDREKPVYKMDVSFDKLFYKNGDKATITVTTTFFDGTPAEGLKINLYSNDVVRINKTLTTDKNGKATYSVTLGNISRKSTSPATIGVSAELIGEETTTLYDYVSATYFHSDLWFECEEIRGEAPLTEIRLNKIDTSSILTQSDLRYPLFPDNIIGDTVDGNVTVTYTKTWWVPHTETVYDPITKTTHKSTYYSVTESVIKKETLKLENGKASIPHIKVSDDFNGYYTCTVSYYDKKTGNTYVLNSNITDYGSKPYVDYGSMGGYNVSLNKELYSVGDEVKVTLTYDGEIPDGRTLFTLYSNGRKEYFVSHDGTYAFTYKNEFIPGAKVLITHFTGNKIQTTSVKHINYDYESNNTAEITLSMNTKTYRPGDNMTIRLTMTKDGKPLEDGYLTLCLVDEACFALGEQKMNPIGQYYQNRYNDNIARNLSFSPLVTDVYDILYKATADSTVNESIEADMPGNAADDRNGDTETDIREDFQNNPIFETLYLNENGEAVVTFTLPDNITEWRITAVGFGGDLDTLGKADVGFTQENIITTLPFFVNLSMSNLYILGDDIAFSAQCYGTADLGRVKYTAEISDESGKIFSKKTLTKDAAERTHFNLGKLEIGSYYLTLTAEAEGYADGVRLPFSVTKSAAIMTAYKNIEINQIHSLSPALYPINITFYDKEYDALFEAASLVRRWYGTRADSNAAHYLLSGILQKVFGQSGYMDGNLAQIQSELSSYNGFIPLIAYGEGDVELTAKIAAVVPEVLTEEAKIRLLSYTEDYLNSSKYTSPEEMTAALLILSGLGEGNLTDLYYARAHLEGYGIKSALYLAAAFAYMGDWTTGNEIVTDILAQYGKENEGELWIAGKNTEDSIEYTALALMTASLVNSEQSKKIASYIATHTSTVELYSLETAAYVKNLVPQSEGGNVLIYKVNGEEHTLKLRKTGTVNLSLTKSEFESLEIISASETLAVRASYKAGMEEALGEGTSSDGVVVKKTVTPYDKEKGLYKVTISYTVKTDRNNEYFTLTDTIPAGARFFRSYERDNSYSSNSYAYLSNSGQTMTGCISIWNRPNDLLSGLMERTYTGSVSYIIRGAVKGEFVCESAVAVNNRTGSFALSERGTFEVE